MADTREHWSSRAAFIVATIGGAIGFGNVWRFPSLAFKYGGGAFFVPYLLALFLIGIPILILETAIGQYFQTGDAGAFGKAHPRFRGVGIASVSCSFVVVAYYSTLLAWVARMFIYACGNNAGWRGATGSEAYDWFIHTVTGLSTADGGTRPTRLVGENVAAAVVVWIVIFACLGFGIRWTGRIAYFTVLFPVIVLFVLMIRAVTLEGASKGVHQYIGRWDFSVLGEKPAVWSEAVSQIFFSIGVTFGFVTAYASYNQRDSPVFSNAIIIALGNSLYSFVAGFAVFATAGYLAGQENVGIEDLNVGGPGLMFGTYPVVLDRLSGGEHWERLFFLTLFMLGIDSAFALVEAVVTVTHDTALLHRFPRWCVTLGVCIVAFVTSLLYCTDTGFWLLDVTDWYINFMLLLVGMFECIAVGWAYGATNQIDKVGKRPLGMLFIAEFVPITIASGVWFGVAKLEPPSGWRAGNWSLLWGFIALFLGGLLFGGLTWYLAGIEMREGVATNLDMRTYWKELLMGNVLHLRSELQSVVRWIPWVWFALIRHVIPQLLLVLFANLAASERDVSGDGSVTEPQFGNYGDYPGGYQALGIVCVVFAAMVIGVGLLFPDLFKCFDVVTVQVDEEQEQEKDVTPKNMENFQMGVEQA